MAGVAEVKVLLVQYFSKTFTAGTYENGHFAAIQTPKLKQSLNSAVPPST